MLQILSKNCLRSMLLPFLLAASQGCLAYRAEILDPTETYARLIKTYPNTIFAKEAGQRLRAAQEHAMGNRG